MIKEFERKTRAERTNRPHPHYQDEEYYPYDDIFVRPLPPEPAPAPYPEEPPVSPVGPVEPAMPTPAVTTPAELQPVSLEEAIADLETAWTTRNLELLMRHVSEKRAIRVYSGDKFSHELTAEQYYVLSRDAFENLETEHFSLNQVRDISDEKATVSGEHVYKSQNGKRQRVLISYVLEREGLQWVVAEIRYESLLASRRAPARPDGYEAVLRGGRRLPEDPNTLELAVLIKTRNGAPFEGPMRLRFIVMDDLQKIHTFVAEPGELAITGSRAGAERPMQAITYLARFPDLSLRAKAVRIKVFLARLQKEPGSQGEYRLQGLVGFDLGWFRLPPVASAAGRLSPSVRPLRPHNPPFPAPRR